MLFEQMHPNWQELLSSQRALLEAIEQKLSVTTDLVPKKERLLRAFETDPSLQKVLIIGQDPYPTPEHATGLAFAVPAGTHPLPPTLQNILKELRSDLGNSVVKTGDLSLWAERGVMLLNRHLSTSAGNSAAHLEIGWAEFTTKAVEALQRVRGENLAAILWGRKAQELAPVLSRASVIASAHPSPLSSYRGFFGSKPFTKTNQLLTTLGQPQIDWSC